MFYEVLLYVGLCPVLQEINIVLIAVFFVEKRVGWSTLATSREPHTTSFLSLNVFY